MALNAGPKPHPEAGAQRTLEGVGSRPVILIEAPSSAYHDGMLIVGNSLRRGGDLMQFYTKQHQTYCGIDLHARTMYVCILNQAGDILVHQNMRSRPDALLRIIAPYRDDI